MPDQVHLTRLKRLLVNGGIEVRHVDE
jgi:hypothetical protein